MNLLLLAPSQLASDGVATLDERQRRHVRRVLGKSIGDTLVVGELGGRVGEGVIEALSEGQGRVRCTFDRDPPAPSRVTLVLALPRPPMLRRVLGHVTAMGVKRIALVGANRVEKSFWDSHSLATAAIDEQLRLGLEQAGDTVLPQVSLHRRFRPFVEDELPTWPAARHRFVADAGPTANEAPPDGSVLVAIGPEGGWVDFERERWADAGLSTFSLGPRPLRVETAVVAAVSRLG